MHLESFGGMTLLSVDILVPLLVSNISYFIIIYNCRTIFTKSLIPENNAEWEPADLLTALISPSGSSVKEAAAVCSLASF